jgi:hypothetical protein
MRSMMRAVAWLGGISCVLILAAAWPLAGEGLQRYSGRVIGIDLGLGTLVVEELGRRGLPIRHEVHVGAETPVVTATRLRLGDMRGQSAFGEMPVSLVDVLVGDFVVVEGEDLEGQTRARRVTIVETRHAP